MTKKIKQTFLYKFTSIKNLPYRIFENKEDLIKLVISRTPTYLIKHNKNKIFFMHPFLKNYACDIHSDVFNLIEYNQPRVYQFQNIINLDLHFNNNIPYKISYDYNKFVRETLKLFRSDLLKFNFEIQYEEAIYDEDRLEKTLDFDMNSYKKNISNILNHNFDNTDDNDDNSDNDNTDDNDDDNSDDDNSADE